MHSKRATALVFAVVLVIVGAPIEQGRASRGEQDHSSAAHDQPAVITSADRSAPLVAPAAPARPPTPAAGGEPALAGDGPLTDWPQLNAPDGKPNVVVFYIDDVGPHDGRLWNDPLVTPAIRDLFVDRGITFTNAVGETPLCCPGRGALLTGLHTHNHGVKVNNALLFNPKEHIGRAMGRAGYDTFWIGKYFNWAERYTAAQWKSHAEGWTQFDVFNHALTGDGPSRPNWFRDYILYTKQGPVRYGDYHSTRMIADRTILHVRQTAADRPIFAILSIFNMHEPNIPMPPVPADVVARCNAIEPWNPPNYNEADVSDKPPYIQKQRLLPYRGGWPMSTYCKEMHGIDSVVARVRAELEADGRFENTVFVFTSDNGMGWGQHRLSQTKRTPYATPVPLMVSWPSHWTGPRTIDDLVSNIDLAPTFCDLGGCQLGPFPSGSKGPDGISMLPVLESPAQHLGRDAVLETSFGTRSWSAVRTASTNPLGSWHYVEYASGFLELYDLAGDPWELENLAYRPSTAGLRSQLSARLAQLLREGTSTKVLRPPRADGTIAFSGSTTYVGNNIYSATPLTGQTRKRTGVSRGAIVKYVARVQNDGQAAGSFNVYGESSGSTALSVRYFYNGADVTTPVTNGSFTIAGIAPTAKASLTVRITVSATAPAGAKRTVLVRFAALDNPGQVDVVRAIAAR